MKYAMLLMVGILVVVQMTASQDTGSTGETAPSPTNPGLQQDAAPTVQVPAAPGQQAADQPQADQPAAEEQPQADQPAAENQPAADEPAANQQADAAPADQADNKKPEEEKREQTPNDAPADPTTRVTTPAGQTSTQPGLLHNPSTVQPASNPDSTMKKEKPTEKPKNSASGFHGSTLLGTALAILLFSAM